MSNLKWAHEVRQVADLKPHPSNAVFGDLPEIELKELAEDTVLSNRVDEIEAYQWVDSLTTLEDGRELIEQLSARIEAIAKESQLGEVLELHIEKGGGD